MMPAPEEISYRTPQRIVPDEFEPLAALSDVEERKVPDFVMSHVHRYAERLQEVRGLSHG